MEVGLHEFSRLFAMIPLGWLFWLEGLFRGKGFWGLLSRIGSLVFSLLGVKQGIFGNSSR